jgi:hypothetical protein
LKEKLGGKIAINENIKKVLSHWIPIFNTGENTSLDASQFDRLFPDGAQFNIGNLNVTVMNTPDDTPDSIRSSLEEPTKVAGFYDFMRLLIDKITLSTQRYSCKMPTYGVMQTWIFRR